MNKELTKSQIAAIPQLLAARNISQGCKAAGISRFTYYSWMKNEDFAAEYERRRKEFIAEAFSILERALEKAACELTKLLDSEDERIKRLCAKDIFDLFIRHKAIDELDQRLLKLEKNL